MEQTKLFSRAKGLIPKGIESDDAVCRRKLSLNVLSEGSLAKAVGALAIGIAAKPVRRGNADPFILCGERM
jgi:hypothetical protein